MAVEHNVRQLTGPWQFGWALDLHTHASRPLALGGYDTERTALGELLYRLKYQGDKSAVAPIAETAITFLRTRWILGNISAIIPVPPSESRRLFQPVWVLAERIGQGLRIVVLNDYLVKVKETHAIKDIEEISVRKAQLQDAFMVRNQSLKGESILVFDDLYQTRPNLRSGASR